MNQFKVNKLVRDKIPERLRAKNILSDFNTLNQDQYRIALHCKLIEEAEECKEAQTRDELIEELSDVLEVIHGILNAYHIDLKTIEEKRLAKRSLLGGFDKKLHCSYVELDESNPYYPDYALRPHKYPKNN